MNQHVEVKKFSHVKPSDTTFKEGGLRDFFLYPGDRERINKDFQDFYERLRILRREREGGMEPMLMAMATGYDYRKYQRVKALEKRSGR